MGFHELNPVELDNYNPFSDSEMIVWDKNRSLQWSDFEGKPDLNNKFGALTESITYRKWDAKVIQTNDKPQFQFTNIKVYALFHKPHSWVKQNVLDSDQHAIILKHEQGHFDISEIFARKMEKALQELATKTYPCNGTTKEQQQRYADEKALEIMNSTMRDIEREKDSFNEKYENDTDHGMRLKQQGRYNLLIEKLLRQS